MAAVQGNEVTIKTVSSPFTLWIRVREWYDTATGKWQPRLEKITMNSSGWYGWTYYLDGTVSVNGTTIFTASSYNGTHPITISAQNTNVSLENLSSGSWITRSLCSSGGTASVALNLRIHTTDGSGGSGTAFSNSGTLNLTATAHNYSNTVTQPTCTAQGYTTHKCTMCGYSYKDTYTAAKGHTNTATGAKRSDATCTAAATYWYKCATCGTQASTYFSSGSAKGHTNVNGGTAGIHTKCSVCGVTTSSTHSYTSSVQTAATCTAKGTTKYSCNCGYNYTAQDIAMIAHDYKSIPVPATCTTQGYTSYKCSRCTSTKANDNYTQALGHEYESEIIIAPTYTAPGTMNYSCIRCDDSYTEAIARKRGAVQINTTTGHRPHLAYVKKANGWVLCVPNVRKSNNEWNPCG